MDRPKSSRSEKAVQPNASLSKRPRQKSENGKKNQSDRVVRNKVFSDGSIALPRNPFVARSTTTAVILPSESRQVSARERVFLVLHRPKELAYLYHLLVLFPVVFNCLILNMLKPKSIFDDQFLYSHYDSIYFAMAIMDCFLFVWFFAEFLLRIWSADCHQEYRDWSGKKRYFHDYFNRRLLDFVALLSYFSFLVYNLVKHNLSASSKANLPIIETVFRIAHVLQVLQIYRVIVKLTKPFYKTLCQQSNPLLLANLCVVIILLIGSLLVYITEEATSETGFESIYNAFWLTFECFSTVGYGDHLIYSKDSKLVICIISIVGIYAFSLPSFIIGNGLSIAVQEQRRMTFKYMSIAELIRTAITHQQIAKQTGRREDTKRNLPKRTTRLMNHHLESFSRLNLLKNDKHFTRLDEEEEEQVNAVKELWSKLLFSKTSKAPDIQNTTAVNKQLHASKESHPNDLSTNSERVMDTLGNMDLTRYSGDNSLLWFHLNLIEDDIDRLNELDEEIKQNLDAIGRIALELSELL